MINKDSQKTILKLIQEGIDKNTLNSKVWLLRLAAEFVRDNEEQSRFPDFIGDFVEPIGELICEKGRLVNLSYTAYAYHKLRFPGVSVITEALIAGILWKMKDHPGRWEQVVRESKIRIYSRKVQKERGPHSILDPPNDDQGRETSLEDIPILTEDDGNTEVLSKSPDPLVKDLRTLLFALAKVNEIYNRKEIDEPFR
jgi:hypothetical protein